MLQGRYRVVRPMGGGGFGKTFEITDRGTRKVLKVLLESQPKAVSLFKQEANALSQLNSPGIPHVDPDGYFTFQPKGCDRSLHCLVMEKINGPTLKDWIKKRGYKPISEERAVTWLKQLTEILELVHRQHYFHRDIKPDNIMLRPNGQLVLIDFGTAREVTETYLAKVGQGQNVTGIVSPGYTPPEQVNGKAVPQSDFFALGRTFVFLLTGKPPTFFSENPRSGKLIWRDKATHISAQLADVIDYMMAPFPGQRPQKPSAILQCLAEVEEQADWSSSTMAGLGNSDRNAKEAGEKNRYDYGSSNTGMTKTVTAEADQGKNQLLNLLSQATGKLFSAAVVVGMVVGGIQVYGYFQNKPLPYNPLSQLLLWGSSYDFTVTESMASRGNAEAVAIDPSGQWLAGSEPGNIRVWRLGESQPAHNIATSRVVVTSLAIDPDGEFLARGGSDTNIRLWKLKGGQRYLTITQPTSRVNAIAFSSVGSILIGGSENGTIQTWEVQSGQLLETLNHQAPVNDIAIAPNGSIIASGGADGTIKLWNLRKETPIRTIKGHQGAINAVAISNDGKLIASGSEDGTVRIWRRETGQQLHAFPSGEGAVNDVLFTPDNKHVVFASQSIQIWRFQTSERIAYLTEHRQTVNDIALNSNGRVLFSGSRDQSFKLWQSP